MLKRTRLSIAIGAAFGAGLASLTPTVVAQTQALDRVEITGSAIRRVDAETALPVTIIRSEELIRQGITTAEQAVKTLSANQSETGVSRSIGASTGGASQADLRGLGIQSSANKTLVLLNGRRLANSAIQGNEGAVDLSAIPLASIDRIEVLRDGASALYGTDAIGGVINFILRRDYTGIELAAEGQWPQESGGGDEHRFTALAGWGNLDKDRFNIMGSIDYRKQKVLLASEREFAQTGILGTGRAAILAGTSGTSFPGDLNGFEPSGPGCAPPSSVPVSKCRRHRVWIVPLRLQPRNRHHSGKRADNRLAARHAEAGTGSSGLGRVCVCEEHCSLCLRGGAIESFDPGDASALPGRRADDNGRGCFRDPRPRWRCQLAASARREARWRDRRREQALAD